MLTALYILAGVVAILLIAAALIPGKFSVKRTIFIQKPVASVFDFALDLNNFNRWSPWYNTEPAALINIQANKQTGDFYSWAGKKNGEGKFIITNIDKDKRIDTRIEFLKPWKQIAMNHYFFEPEGTGVKVTWQYDGTGTYPVGRFFNLMMDRFLGNDFEKGLEKLKTEIENKS